MSSASFIIPLRKHSHTLGSSCIWEKLFGFCFFIIIVISGRILHHRPQKLLRKVLFFQTFTLTVNQVTTWEKKKKKRKTCVPFLWPQRAGPLKFLLLFWWWHHCGHRIGKRGLLWSKTYFPCTLAPLVFELPSCHSPLTSALLFGEKPQTKVFLGGLVHYSIDISLNKSLIKQTNLSDNNWVAALKPFNRPTLDDVRGHVRLHRLSSCPSFSSAACQRALIWGTVFAHAAHHNHSINGCKSAEQLPQLGNPADKA